MSMTIAALVGGPIAGIAPTVPGHGGTMTSLGAQFVRSEPTSMCNGRAGRARSDGRGRARSSRMQRCGRRRSRRTGPRAGTSLLTCGRASCRVSTRRLVVADLFGVGHDGLSNAIIYMCEKTLTNAAAAVAEGAAKPESTLVFEQ